MGRSATWKDGSDFVTIFNVSLATIVEKLLPDVVKFHNVIAKLSTNIDKLLPDVVKSPTKIAQYY
jgi:hypothetical protein